MKREKKNLIFLIAGIVLVSLLGVVFYQSALPTVQSFYTDQTSLVMDIHSEDNLKFHADPERCKYGKVEYISSDPDVLSVIPDETDKLTCKLVSFDLEGTAQIQIRQVQKNGVNATVLVKVEDKSHLQGYHKEKPPEMDGFNYFRYSPRPEGGSLGYSSSSKLSNGPLRPERWSLVYSTFSSTPFSISFLACAEGRAA